MSNNSEVTLFYELLIEWINTKEFFWMKDLRLHFGCLSSDEKDFPVNKRIKLFIFKVKNNGGIQCTEVRSSERQYYRVRIVTIKDVSLSKKNI